MGLSFLCYFLEREREISMRFGPLGPFEVFFFFFGYGLLSLESSLCD
jgi:hypothetical protein